MNTRSAGNRFCSGLFGLIVFGTVGVVLVGGAFTFLDGVLWAKTPVPTVVVRENQHLTNEYLAESIYRVDQRIDALIDRVILLELEREAPEIEVGYLEDELYSLRDVVDELGNQTGAIAEDVDYALGWIDEMYAVICYGDVAALNEEAMCD